MKICIFEITEAEKEDYFVKELEGHEVTFIEDPLAEGCIPEETDFDIISVFVCSKVTDKVISAFPNLKHIATRSTGFDHIDTQFAKSKGITVSTVPAYGSHTVAEFAFGLILSLSRKIPAAVNRIKMGNDFDFEGLRGFDLSEKTLGVVGTGKIGANVIRIAKGFNMKVLACDPYPNNELSKTLGFEYVSLGELLRDADIVTLHTPYLPETHHLINKENILLMKKGAFLINTSRGAVVETEALFQALTQEHIAGAALDVFEEENDLKEEAELLSNKKVSAKEFRTVVEDHILMHLPNVIATPHMAFYTKEAEFSILETTVKNIKGFISGSPENIV